jgi:hypothetical protein
MGNIEPIQWNACKRKRGLPTTKDLVHYRIIKKKPELITGRYSLFALDSAVGAGYITHSSPHYISGHLRLLGKNNGKYPHKIKELINELFGSCPSSSEELEVCSGEVVAKSNLVTVDINPAKNPSYVLDGQHLPKEWNNHFGRWNCDPPYSEHAAKEMYGTDMPSITKLLSEGARVTESGGLLFLLLGAKNMQWHPESVTRIGWLGITVVPNQEIRALHCYVKK